MADVVMIATMVGFILLCVAYVQWCDRMIGSEPEAPTGPAATDEPAPARDQIEVTA